MGLIADMIRAGVSPELVEQAAERMADERARGALLVAPARSKAADRQARYRERKASQSVTNHNSVTLVTESDASVTPEAENREASRACSNTNLPSEDISYIPPLPPKPEKAQSRQRGHRLPKTWQPSADVLSFAKSLGFTEDLERRERAAFFDYWLAIPGSKGCKLDWDATYRNRLRDMAGRLKLKPAANVLPFGAAADPPRPQMTEAEKRAAALKFDAEYRAGKYG
jgi:hypothetical protein